MSDEMSADSDNLPLEVLDRIDRICDRFEAAWGKAKQPRVEDYMDAIELPYRSALIRDLLAAEIDARRRRGDHLVAGEYARRFPEQAEYLLKLFPALELIEPAKPVLGERASPSSKMEAELGLRTLGDYRIDSELGRGGMGVVYRAFDIKRGVMVALKTMHRTDSSAILRFKNEFRALADISHPNLVALYELAADCGSWFFTMELVEGVDFLTFVRANSELATPIINNTDSPAANRDLPISLAQGHPRQDLSPGALSRLRAALRQLAEGVAVLHDAGMLHRDLKPSNVLVTRQGRVVILDFGLAAELGPLGQHQSSVPQVLGTVSYVSPEQAAGLPVSRASDWYSLGSILFEVLTGRPPFLGLPLEVLMDKQRFEPPAPCELVPGIPEDLNVLCVDLLRREPEARPGGRDVLRRLGSATGVPELPIPLQPSPHHVAILVGRDRDLQCLEAAYEEMTRGRALSFYIHGPSGIGKSALVRRFLDDLSARDAAVVLVGRCLEQESVPYKALDSVIDALTRYLKRLPLLEAQALLPRDIGSLIRIFPVLREAEAVATAPRSAILAADPQELRRRAFQALRELLARLGDRRPLVLAIDDLQWGDSDSAAVLLELLRPPEAPRLLLLGCYRSEDAATSSLLRTLLENQAGNDPDGDRRVLALGTLERADAEALARSLLGREDQTAKAHAVAIARESGGNPFFIAELVRYVQADAGLVGRVPATDEVALDEVLWARTRRLPEGARRLLEVIAVSGRPLGQAEACRAAGLSASERTALSLLRSGRLIRSTSPADRDEIETYHDRVREAIVAKLSPMTLQEYHRCLACVLESKGRADPEVLAVHFQAAGEFEPAGKYFAQAAGHAAEALAFVRAAKLYRTALELCQWDHAEARKLRIALGDALVNAGRGAEAAREYLIAASDASAAEAFELRRRAAMQFLICGHLDEGLAELSAVLRAVGMKLPETPRRAMISLIVRRLRLRLRGLHYRRRDSNEISPRDLARIDVGWSVASGLGIIDPIRGAVFQTSHLLLALQAGEPFRIARALCVEASHVSSSGGNNPRGLAKLISALHQIAEPMDHPYIWGGVSLTHGMATYMGGRWKEAGEHLDRADHFFRNFCAGVTWELDMTTLLSLWSLQFRGELVELGRRWPATYKEACERGDLNMVTNLSTSLKTTLQLAADEPDEILAEMRQVMSQWTRNGFHVQHNEWFGAEVQARLYLGDRSDAWNFMTTQYAPALARSHLLYVQKIRVFLFERRARCALDAATAIGGSGLHLRSAKRDAKRLERENMPWSRALAYPILGGIAAHQGDRRRALDLFRAAVSHLEAVDMNLYAAASRRRLGELLGGDEGLAYIKHADSWMKQQGIKNPARMSNVFAPVVEARG